MEGRNLNPLAALAALLCLVSGHNPAEARKHGDLHWYTATGLVMLATGSLSALSAYELLHGAMGTGIAFAAIGAVFAFVFVYCVDLFINMTPRLGDSLRHRLVFLLVRGPLGVVIAAFIGLGTALHLNQDDINAYVAQQAASHAAADVSAFTEQAPQTKEINTDNNHINTLASQNSQMEQTATAKKNAWWKDMVPCQAGGSLTCQGDIPGWGPNSRVLYADYKNYANDTLQPTEKANDAEIATLQKDINQAQTSLDAAQKRLATADQADTGLAAQTRALLHIMSRNWVLWILPIVILAWDQTVVLAKILFPRRRTEIAEQEKREDQAWARTETKETAALLRAERTRNPAWTAARAQAHEHAAAMWLAEEKARLAKRTRAAAEAASSIGKARTGARLRIRPVTALITAVALALAGTGIAVLSGGSGSGSVRHAAAAAGNGAAAGQPIVVRVGPGSGVTVRVPKVGMLVAAKGSFSSPGTMTITARSATPPAGDGVTLAGPGVDVTFNGTKLVKPVTLAFTSGAKPSPNAIPVIAHRADNGQWNYLAASITGGMLTGVTSHFSLNVPAWVASIGQWVSDVGQWVGQRLASALAGRTSPLTCSGPPNWFHVASGHSDLVHVCAKDAGPDSNGVDRAEIQIKSNRGVSIQVNVPGNPQYVWVEDQPFSFRQVVMDSLGQDPNKTVILPAGKTMTIGYVRTPQSQDLTATVSSYTGLALLDTVIRQALEFALPTIDPIFPGYVMFECASGFKPAAVTATPNFSDNGIAGVLQCMFHEAIGAVDGNNAENIATQIGAFVERTGKSVSADTIEATAKLIRAAAVDVSILLPALQDSAGNLWDAVQSWYTGGVSNQVNYSIDGPSQAGASGPITVGPGGLQGGSNTGPGIQGGTGSGGIQGGSGTGSTSQGSGSTSGGGTGSSSPSPSASSAPAPQQHVFYDNYGSTTQGVPMCRGNQGNTASMPGGTVTETFTADAAGTINSAKVQIDPDTTVTATAVLSVNGTDMASNSQPASGDTVFTFSPVTVKTGDTVSLRISFTATYGKIITIYQVGNPGGTFSVSNSCPDGAPTFTRADTGLRAVVSGTS